MCWRWPPHPTWKDSTWHRHALEAGARGVELLDAPESGHFEMIVPGTSTWPLVREALAERFRAIAG